MAIIFDGKGVAAGILADLRAQVRESGKKIKIVSLCFTADKGSVFYAREKQIAAEKVGMEYEIVNLDFGRRVEEIEELIEELNCDQAVTGIMIQKPRRQSYEEFWQRGAGGAVEKPELSFAQWWEKLVAKLAPKKDVDGLSLQVLKNLQIGVKPKILPATVEATLESLKNIDLMGKKILVLGRTDILGLPLYHYWREVKNYQVTNWGQKDLAQQLISEKQLKDFQVIVAATGKADLIKGEMVAENTVLIDVGWPKGDFEWRTCVEKASYITPVPGGIGPVTVAKLLNNAWLLANY